MSTFGQLGSHSTSMTEIRAQTSTRDGKPWPKSVSEPMQISALSHALGPLTTSYMTLYTSDDFLSRYSQECSYEGLKKYHGRPNTQPLQLPIESSLILVLVHDDSILKEAPSSSRIHYQHYNKGTTNPIINNYTKQRTLVMSKQRRDPS